MSVVVTSTTDSKEAVIAAQGDLASDKVEDKEESASAAKPDENAEGSESSENPESDDADSDENESEKEESGELKPKKKASGGFKRRIDKLNSKLSASEQEKEYWRAQALKNNSEPVKESTPEKPDLATRPKADDFDSHDQYIDALTDWKVEKKLSARDVQQRETAVKSEFEKQVNTHLERVEKFAKNHSDFHELMEDVDDVPMSLTVREVILGSEDGPKLMYELAKNKEEYKRICNLPAIAAARELGKFEAKVISSSDSPKESKELKTTKAPKPISPVGSKSSNGSNKSPDEMSYQEYKTWRAANPNG